MEKALNSNEWLENEKDESSKSSSIFGASFRGIKENILSGLSSKLGAFQSSFIENVTTNQDFQLINNFNNTGPGLLGPKKKKDRSIFGQPEIVIPSNSLQKSKDISLDSLDTLDSGQSMGGSSCVSANDLANLELHDTVHNYRPTESIGIGSGPETSLDSSEDDSSSTSEDSSSQYTKNDSIKLVRTQTSCTSSVNQTDDKSDSIKVFMKRFVAKIFDDSNSVTLNEKSTFGAYCLKSEGRFYFSRFINEQRIYWKQVSESTFYSLVQYFAIILFECSEADDFTPAKTIMNMCFTFYYEPQASKNLNQHYLYCYLKDQPIWKSIRFWRAVFFDSLSLDYQNQKCPKDKIDLKEEAKFTENTSFGQLGAIAYYMKEFGLSREFCSEFIRKQVTIANLPKEQVMALQQNLNTLYSP